MIKEKNSSSAFKCLLQDYFKPSPKENDVVRGVVLFVSKSEVRVDIGGMIVGVVRGRELVGSEYADLKPGDEIEATVLEEENENGEVELSFRTAGFVRAWNNAVEFLKNQQVTEVKVADANKGGLMVSFGPLKGFLPVSQLSPDNYPRVPGGDKGKILEHLRQFIGKDIKVKVIDVSQKDEKFIVSEKMVWEEDQKDVLGKYAVGDIVEGKVNALTSFGAFIEFGDGLEGLVHISEIAWQRIDHPHDVLTVGQTVKAQVIQIDGSKIFLSMKRLVDDPWKTVKERYQIGQKVIGKVLKVNPFGLFVELDPEIHGLAHISELSGEPIADIDSFVKAGDEMEFEVVSIEPAAHRLGLRTAGVEVKSHDSMAVLQHDSTEEEEKEEKEKKQPIDAGENSQEPADEEVVE